MENKTEFSGHDHSVMVIHIHVTKSQLSVCHSSSANFDGPVANAKGIFRWNKLPCTCVWRRQEEKLSTMNKIQNKIKTVLQIMNFLETNQLFEGIFTGAEGHEAPRERATLSSSWFLERMNIEKHITNVCHITGATHLPSPDNNYTHFPKVRQVHWCHSSVFRQNS